MAYELTPLFTTIAAASASIVAILGGFIASKLISISGDRDAVLSKLQEVNEEIDIKQLELDELAQIEREEYALGFVEDHVNELLNKKELSTFIQTESYLHISINDLQPLWQKAFGIVESLLTIYEERKVEEIEYNADGLPVLFAQKYNNDHFSYNVGKAIIDYIKDQNKANTSFGVVALRSSIFRGLSISEQQRQDNLGYELKELYLKKALLTESKNRLVRPKGMKAGLIIFALFSAFCIVLPLLLSPFSTDNMIVAWLIKLCILELFIVGLVAIFIYLVSLLRWRDSQK